MKKITTFILVALLPLVANAYDAQIDGIYYNFSGDEAEVTEGNARGDYQIDDDEIITYDYSYSGTVTIPETVTYNEKIYSVTSIGDGAFSYCRGLTSVTIPCSVTSIGKFAFVNCSGLTSIRVAESNTTYDSRNDCNAIIETATNTLIAGCQNSTIPDDVTSIGDEAFAGCSGLTSLTIPGTVTSIGWSVFNGCSGLTSISVAESNTTYDSRNDCNAIIETATNTLITGCQNTTIPDGVTRIYDSAFIECSGLTSITIPNSVTSIGHWAFGHCSGLTSVTIGNSVTTIGHSAFRSCSSLTDISIPNSVTTIGDWAFSYCRGLTSITIPNNVTDIPAFAFSHCSSLTSVTIPGSVTSISYYAFEYCSGLTSVIVDRATPLTISEGTFSSSNQSNATLYVPYGSKSAYEAADYWKDFNEIIEFNPINVGGTGFATYCSECDLDFSEVSGLKAYIASGFSPSTGKLVLTRVTEVPAGEGLYLVGDEGRYNIPTTTTDMFYSNLLKGVTTATTIYPTDGSYTNFILANGSHGVAFYSLSAAGELAAGKAYLQLPTTSASDVKAISVIFDDDEDAIQSIEEESQTQRIYNLQGQQVNTPKNGLYIVNGKKVFIK